MVWSDVYSVLAGSAHWCARTDRWLQTSSGGGGGGGVARWAPRNWLGTFQSGRLGCSPATSPRRSSRCRWWCCRDRTRPRFRQLEEKSSVSWTSADIFHRDALNATFLVNLWQQKVRLAHFLSKKVDSRHNDLFNLNMKWNIYNNGAEWEHPSYNRPVNCSLILVTVFRLIKNYSVYAYVIFF